MKTKKLLAVMLAFAGLTGLVSCACQSGTTANTTMDDHGSSHLEAAGLTNDIMKPTWTMGGSPAPTANDHGG